MALNYTPVPKSSVSASFIGPTLPGQRQSYTAPQQQVLGASTSIGGGNNNNIPSSATNSSQSLQQGISAIQSGQDAGNAQIEADYNQSMSMLDNAGQQLQGQGAAASAQIDTGAGAATTQINNEQTTATNAANTSLGTAETQGKTAMQQARDLYRQTQQNNSAQASALGISSSSVTDALAEKLGVETARRIANVGDSLDQVRQNTVNELGRIKTYYQGQLTTLTQHVADQKAQIQNSLIAGLNQINAARGQAANDKAAARSNLLSQTQNAISSLAQQQQQFQQSLDAWAQQKAAALTPIVQDPNYLNTLLGYANTINQNPGIAQTGLVATPQLNVGANGQLSGQISTSKLPIDPNTGLPYQQTSGNNLGGPPAGL